jgi:hypothetical protein
MNSFINENRSVFIKTDKTDLIQFYRFTENQMIEFEIFENLRNFKIKNSKKTSLHFKTFGQNRIQKFVVFHPRKIKKVCPAVKSGKKELTGSF